jgi:hypothetical protein
MREVLALREAGKRERTESRNGGAQQRGRASNGKEVKARR